MSRFQRGLLGLAMGSSVVVISPARFGAALFLACLLGVCVMGAIDAWRGRQ